MPTKHVFRRKTSTHLSSHLVTGICALAVFGFAFGVRLWMQSRAAPQSAAVTVASAQEDALQWSRLSSASERRTVTDAFPTLGPSETPLPTNGDVLTPAGVIIPGGDIQPGLQTVVEKQVVKGVAMTISNFYRTGQDLLVSLCYDQLGTEAWDMGPGTLTYANGKSSSFAANPTLDQRGSAAGPGRYCHTLDFDRLPPDADLSQLSLSIENVHLKGPDEGHECEFYGIRLANSLKLKELGIKAECKQGGGGASFEVVSKPAGMSDDEALRQAGLEASEYIIGPWVFANAKVVTAN